MSQIRFFSALGDETRLAIVLHLLRKSHSVSELVKKIKLSQPAISLALRVLLEAGIVKKKRDGKQIIYSIANPDVEKAMKLGGARYG